MDISIAGLQYKPDFSEARKYLKAFWEKEIIDRPAVCVTAPKGVSTIKRPKYMDGWDGDHSGAVDRFEECAKVTYYGGEAVPVMEISYGPDQFSAFLGLELNVMSTSHTSWVKPLGKDWKDAKITLDHSGEFSLGSIKQFLKYTASRGEGKFLINTLDIHGDLDSLCALAGPEELCVDLLLCPDEAEQVLDAVRPIFFKVYEEVFEAGNMHKYGSVAGPMYYEGKTGILQSDVSCMISRELGERFVLPALREQAAYLDKSVYHLDGKDALRHLEGILDIEGIDVIQWVPGDGNPRSPEWMDLLQKIQNAGKSLWIYDWTVDEIKEYHKQLRPEKVIFQVEAKTLSEADELIEHLRKNT